MPRHGQRSALDNALRMQQSSSASDLLMFEQAVALTTVRPVLTVLRTVRMTMAAARASRPAMGICMLSQLRSTGSQAAKVAHDPQEAKEYKQPRAASSVRPAADNRPGQAVHAGRQFAPEVGSSMNTMEGLATCKAESLTLRWASTIFKQECKLRQSPGSQCKT